MNNVKDFPEIKQDKDGMIIGNDAFLDLIDKVIDYELQNQRMEEELKILPLRNDFFKKVNDIMVKAKTDLDQQVQTLEGDQNKLKKRLSEYNQEDLDRRCKEIKQRKDKLEKEILNNTEELKDEQIKKVGLMVEKRVLRKKLELLRAGYDEEFKELESQVQNEKRILSDSNKRSLDLEPIIKSLEARYAEIAERAKEEAEQLNQKKINALVQTAEQCRQEVRSIDQEIIILKQSISHLKELKATEEELKTDLAQERGGDDAESTVDEITKLEERLKTEKENLAQQVLKQQELLNLKLGLDMEIATYNHLLQNEEESLKKSTTDAKRTNEI